MDLDVNLHRKNRLVYLKGKKRERPLTLNSHSLSQCLVCSPCCRESPHSGSAQAKHVPTSSLSVHFLAKSHELGVEAALWSAGGWGTGTCFLLLDTVTVGIGKDRHWGWGQEILLQKKDAQPIGSQNPENCGHFFHKSQGKGKNKTKQQTKQSYAYFFMGSFSSSFLDKKTSETFLCLQKAICLSLAAATSEVGESSCLLSMAGSSSTAFKAFKVPETEVQQCYDTNSRKLRWQIFRSTFFVLCNATKQKTLQKPKTYCSPANAMQFLFSYSSQNVIWSTWRESVPKSSNLLVKNPGIT